MKYNIITLVVLLNYCSNILATNTTWNLPFPDLSTKPMEDNSIIPGLKANVNGQTIYNISKNIWMGLEHPTLWDDTHCIQVPYFANALQKVSDSKACQPLTGWYFKAKGNGQCVTATVPCSGLATLNFFATQEDCQRICFNPDGTGQKLIPTDINLDPRVTCNDKPIITLGTSAKQKLVWTYDAITQTCWEFFIPSDTTTSWNIYKDGAVCQHMCHDVAPPGSGLGHSLISGDMMNDMDMSMHMAPPPAPENTATTGTASATAGMISATTAAAPVNTAPVIKQTATPSATMTVAPTAVGISTPTMIKSAGTTTQVAIQPISQAQTTATTETKATSGGSKSTKTKGSKAISTTQEDTTSTDEENVTKKSSSSNKKMKKQKSTQISIVSA